MKFYKASMGAFIIVTDRLDLGCGFGVWGFRSSTRDGSLGFRVSASRLAKHREGAQDLGSTA